MTNMEMNFPDELSAFDYLLYRGEANPSTRSTLLAIMTLETSPDRARLERVIDRASRTFIRLRQKVVEPSNNYSPARWVVDPDFNLHYHLRRVSLSEPKSQEALLTLASQLNATPFDVCRPLWELMVVDGIDQPGVKTALIFKIHHAVCDGMGALKLFQQLLEFDAKAPEPEMPLIPVPEEMSPEQAAKVGKRNALGQAIPTAKNYLDIGSKLLRKGLTRPVDVISDVFDYGDSARKVLGDKGLHCSPLLSGRSLVRNLGIIEVPLAELKRAAKSTGATVNDGFLAAVSIGLSKYHQGKLVEINELSIAMPVNTRPDDATDGGNYFSGARVNLPLGETDVAACLKKINDRVKQAKAEPALTLLNHLTPTISRISSRAMNTLVTKVKRPDVQLSNVQGYPVTAFLAGSKVSKLIPFGPVPNVAAMITMVSHDATCYVGIHSDKAAFNDFELLKSSLQQGFDEVLQLSTKTQPKKKRAAKKVAKKAKKTSKKAITKTAKKPASKAVTARKAKRSKKQPLKVSAKQSPTKTKTQS